MKFRYETNEVKTRLMTFPIFLYIDDPCFGRQAFSRANFSRLVQKLVPNVHFEAFF